MLTLVLTVRGSHGLRAPLLLASPLYAAWNPKSPVELKVTSRELGTTPPVTVTIETAVPEALQILPLKTEYVTVPPAWKLPVRVAESETVFPMVMELEESRVDRAGPALLTATFTLTEWKRGPLVPVIVATKLLAELPVQDNVDEPEPPVMLVAESVQDRLVELVVVPRVTVPVNPFTGDTVIMEVPAVPTVAVTLIGFAVIAKSGCATVVT